MKVAFSFLLGGVLVLVAACRKSNESNSAPPPGSMRLQRSSAAVSSLVHFADAEEKLYMGEYTFAAAQLNKGIVAYRTETGKMHGNAARQANKAIDALISFRKTLREGKPVNPIELQQAIRNALAVEGIPLPTTPQQKEGGLGVPVSGN